MVIQENGLAHFPQHLAEAAHQAEHEWRQFLLGESPHPGPFEQHLIPLDAVANANQEVPRTINRYLLRAIDVNAVSSEKQAVVWVKFPYFLLVGWIRVRVPKHWSGTNRVLKNAGLT